MNIFNKPINEIIKSRQSVRTYENNELPKDVLNKVKTYVYEINNSKGIFGDKIRINLIEKNDENKETKHLKSFKYLELLLWHSGKESD